MDCKSIGLNKQNEILFKIRYHWMRNSSLLVVIARSKEPAGRGDKAIPALIGKDGLLLSLVHGSTDARNDNK